MHHIIHHAHHLHPISSTVWYLILQCRTLEDLWRLLLDLSQPVHAM